MKNYSNLLGATVTGTTTHGDPFTGTVVRVDQSEPAATMVSRDNGGPTLTIEVDGPLTGGPVVNGTVQYRLPEFGWKHQWLTIETTTLATEVK